MKTRSVKSSQVSALGLRSGEADEMARLAFDRQPPGSGAAELQIGGGCARPAIEEERHRPGARVGAIELIGGVGDIGLRLALVVEQAERAGRRGERQACARAARGFAWWWNPRGRRCCSAHGRRRRTFWRDRCGRPISDAEGVSWGCGCRGVASSAMPHSAIRRRKMRRAAEMRRREADSGRMSIICFSLPRAYRTPRFPYVTAGL